MQIIKLCFVFLLLGEFIRKQIYEGRTGEGRGETKKPNHLAHLKWETFRGKKPTFKYLKYIPSLETARRRTDGQIETNEEYNQKLAYENNQSMSMFNINSLEILLFLFLFLLLWIWCLSLLFLLLVFLLFYYYFYTNRGIW